MASPTFISSNEDSSPCYLTRYFTPYKEIQVWPFLQNNADVLISLRFGVGICAISLQGQSQGSFTQTYPSDTFPSSRTPTPSYFPRRYCNRPCWTQSRPSITLRRRPILLRNVIFTEGSKIVTHVPQPSLMNFCITDGESVVATRYISSREDEAASLVTASSFLFCH